MTGEQDDERDEYEDPEWIIFLARTSRKDIIEQMVKIARTKDSVSVTQDKHEKLAYPFYTDNRFREPQLVYGSGDVRAPFGWDSDRIWQHDWDRARSAQEAANALVREGKIAIQTCAWWEAFLSAWEGCEVEVVSIYASYATNGNPIWGLGWERK